MELGRRWSVRLTHGEINITVIYQFIPLNAGIGHSKFKGYINPFKNIVIV